MLARTALTRAGLAFAVAALSACASAPKQGAMVRDPSAQPQSEVSQPAILSADVAVARVAEALDVNVRKRVITPAPEEAKLAAAGITPRTYLINSRLQCVPFARERSGVAIRGNANTWWRQAAGEFVRIDRPAIGSVIVMNTRRGHVGVVTRIIDNRTIVIDHANWLSNGQIYIDQPVKDVSENNDWSRVRVWNGPKGHWGSRELAVPGFILNAPAQGNQRIYASLSEVPPSLRAKLPSAATVNYAEAAPAAATMMASVETETAGADSEPQGPVAASAPVPRAKPQQVAALARPETVANAEVTSVAEAPVVRGAMVAGATVPTRKPSTVRASGGDALVARREEAAPSTQTADAGPVEIPRAKPARIAGNGRGPAAALR